jgi:hypothetical protein
MEKLGVPGLLFVSSNFMDDARSASVDFAMPGIRKVILQSEQWYRYRGSKEEVRPIAEAVFDSVIERLTTPLTSEEINPPQKDKMDLPPFKITGSGSVDAIEKFNDIFIENQMSDGLPLIPPTREAVDLMLAGTKRSPDEVIGKIPMKFGIATVEKIAINAVMAGAKPEYFPVIIAAMEAFCEGDFFHMMGSSGGFTLIILVNGPIVKKINMNSGIGFLGDCWRANSTIGRSIRLATRNIGHTWPAINDMALVGRPSPHIFYTFAENEDMSPWEPFHVSLGFKKEESTVTVTKVGSYSGSGATGQKVGGGAVATWTEQSILEGMAEYTTSSRNGYYTCFHPTAAKGMDNIGLKSRKAVQEWFAKRTKGPEENISVIVTGGEPGYSLIWSYDLSAHVTKKIEE